jgi:hypothetical protein
MIPRALNSIQQNGRFWDWRDVFNWPGPLEINRQIVQRASTP